MVVRASGPTRTFKILRKLLSMNISINTTPASAARLNLRNHLWVRRESYRSSFRSRSVCLVQRKLHVGDAVIS